MLEKLLLNTKIVAALAAGLAVAGTGGAAAATVSLASHHGPAHAVAASVDPSESGDPSECADPSETADPSEAADPS